MCIGKSSNSDSDSSKGKKSCTDLSIIFFFLCHIFCVNKLCVLNKHANFFVQHNACGMSNDRNKKSEHIRFSVKCNYTVFNWCIRSGKYVSDVSHVCFCVFFLSVVFELEFDKLLWLSILKTVKYDVPYMRMKRFWWTHSNVSMYCVTRWWLSDRCLRCHTNISSTKGWPAINECLFFSFGFFFYSYII